MVEGLRATYSDDAELLKHGMAMFAALYESLRQPAAKPPRKIPQALRAAIDTYWTPINQCLICVNRWLDRARLSVQYVDHRHVER